MGIKDRMVAMTATRSINEAAGHKGARGRRGHAFYVSPKLAANAEDANSVSVDVSIHSDAADFDLFRDATSTPRERSTANSASAKAVQEALRRAAEEFLRRSFAAEIGKVVDAYRVMLRESLATGEDPKLQAALNRARLQERILASTPMVDQAQACELLGLSGANPSATMKRKENRELLRFTIDGRAVYPLFQFDVEGRRPFPAMARLISKKPKNWSDFRLLHWLTRPHLDLEGTPAEALGTTPDGVIAAFERESEPAAHG